MCQCVFGDTLSSIWSRLFIHLMTLSLFQLRFRSLPTLPRQISDSLAAKSSSLFTSRVCLAVYGEFSELFLKENSRLL